MWIRCPMRAGLALALCGCLVAVAMGGAAPPPAGPGVEIQKGEGAVEVKINGKLFTRYLFAGAPKPYFWPIIGPTGEPITRAYPMEKVEGETADHPHQRSLWFTHGLVNGIDFWSEGDKAGRQVQRGLAVHSTPSVGRISAETDWLGPDGKRVASDKRELRFYASEPHRLMDFDITIHASDGPLSFGDTKEGMFGVRVASTMDVDRKMGGRIVNSRGETDAEAWGRPAEWVDYSGPLKGKTVGITIMNHPSSFRHPTHWHVRTYGLFAANPFGLHDFYRDKSKEGGHTVPQGESVTFRYRILFHEGDAASAKLAEAYADYAKF